MKVVDALAVFTIVFVGIPIIGLMVVFIEFLRATL
jgi:uncharacterized protein (DUF983 family)